MNEKLEDKQLTELRLDHVRIANKFRRHNNKLNNFRLHATLFISSKGRNLLKYTLLIISFIFCMANGYIPQNTNSHLSELITIITIGTVFSVVWVVTNKDT